MTRIWCTTRRACTPRSWSSNRPSVTSPRRHLWIAGAIWAVLSIVGAALVAGIQILPVIASREAEIEDSAFVLLTVL